MTRITCLYSGDMDSNYYEHVVLLTTTPLKQLKKEHDDAIEKSRGKNRHAIITVVFAEWLIENGYAREPLEEELSIIDEDTL